MRYDRGYTITENISTLGYSISLWKGILEKYYRCRNDVLMLCERMDKYTGKK